MANYRVSPTAKADLRRIWFYGLEHWGVKAADRYHDAFFEHFERLAEQPLLYPVSEHFEGYRRSPCGSDSVYYRVDRETVEIMAIIGRQDVRKKLTEP